MGIRYRVWVPVALVFVLVIAALVYWITSQGPRLELQIVISTLILALILMWVQSLYWEIRYRVWVPAALVIGLVTATLVYIIASWRPNLSLVPLLFIEAGLIAIVAAAVLFLWFFRDPERIPPEKDGVILSPADGKIIYVKKIEEGNHFVSVKAGTRFQLDELLKAPWPFKGGYLIGIEMNVLDVHVNRAPVGGRVVLRQRVAGKFPGLGKPNAEVRSERFTTVIDNGKIQVGVVQIASRFVRRIVSYVREGQPVQPGQRIGMIRFGSQVDLVIPSLGDCQIAVEPGVTVRAGLTVIARYSQEVTLSLMRTEGDLPKKATR
jgi:phosphatidylserine decarboxylase